MYVRPAAGPLEMPSDAYASSVAAILAVGTVPVDVAMLDGLPYHGR